MPDVRTASLGLEIVLEGIENDSKYLELASRIKASLNVIANWNNLNTFNNQIVQDFLNIPHLESRRFLNGQYVVVCAAFEKFLRESLETAINDISQKTKSFQELDPLLVNRNMIETGRLLMRVENPSDHVPIDIFELCKNLGGCHPNSTDFKLNADAISLLNGVKEIDKYLDYLRLCGIKIDWDKLCQDKEIQKRFGTKATRETTKKSAEFLTNLVRIRNRIAHTGDSPADITFQQLSDTIAVIRAIKNAISANLMEH